MNILYTILIGFFIGLIARALKPGDDRMGLIMTTLFGIGGALLAKYVGLAMNWYKDGEPLCFVAALVGAIALLTIYSLIRPKQKPQL